MRGEGFLKSKSGKLIIAISLPLAVVCILLAVAHALHPESDLFTGRYFVQILFSGIVLGCVYALIALGYTMVYGVIQLINFAHGDVYMLGAYFGYFSLRFYIRVLCFDRGLPLAAAFFAAMFTAMAICAVFGFLMEKFAYLPLRKSTRIAALITAVGMSFFLENLGIIVFSANPKSFAPNSFVVYTVEVADNSGFNSPDRKILYQDTRWKDDSTGEAFVRVRARTEAGKSGWSDTVALSAATGFASGRAADYPASMPQGIPAPAGISVTRLAGESAGTIEVKWIDLPKSYRNIKPVFGSGQTFIPLDFGLGAKPAAAQSVGDEPPPRSRFGITATPIQIVIILTTAVLLFLLWWLIHRTQFGLAMRAVSLDKDVTRLMGIDTDAVISKTFALGSALAAVAGCLVGLYWESIFPLMGILPGIKAFVAAVVGGIGSVPGAAAGGLIMGVSEFLVKGYIPASLSALSDAVAFAFLIVVLLVKPTGLLGRTTKEKV